MGNRIAILATLCLVLMPWGYFRGRQEIAAWQAAAAQIATWEDNHQDALQRWNRALAWDPASGDYLMARAETKAQLGQVDEALKDAELAYRQFPNSDSIFHQYCLALARAGRSAEAAQLLEERLKAVNSNDIDELTQLRNGVAYHLALANRDLDKALELINLALVRFPNSGAMLDTRGYIHLKRGQLDEALVDVDRAIAQTRVGVAQQDAENRMRSIDQRDLARHSKAARQELAVLLYHRSLIYTAKAEHAPEEEAKRNFEVSAALDRSEIRSLGFVADDRLM